MSNHGLVVHARGPGPTAGQLTREILDVCVALPLFAITPLIRPWHRRWGSTREEAIASMPGDDLVQGCQYVVTRAINIDAPPSAVWPWLVQIGFGKAGYYSNDLLDNFGHPSASRIVDELQDLNVGDWVAMFTRVNDITAFKVVEINSPKHLVWLKPDSTWSWLLVPTIHGTRLITRIRIWYRWHKLGDALFSLFLNEFGDFAMMRKMLLTIKHHVESNAGETN